MSDADRAHAVAPQEALNIGVLRQRGGGHLEMSRFGVERLPAELTVEILRVLGGAVEMNGGGAAVAESERRPAKPIFSKCDALRARRRRAESYEMVQRRFRLRQEAKRNPASEKFGFDIGVARDE